MRTRFIRWVAAAAVLAAVPLMLAASAETPVGVSGPRSPVRPSAETAAVMGTTTAASSSSGGQAIARLGTRLPTVARGYGWTARKLTEMLLTDSTLRVDTDGRLFYAESALDSVAASAVAQAAAEPLAAAPFPLAQTFRLHSMPGAKLTILLDFGPRTMSGNIWTDTYNAGANIACPVWSTDADPAFSDTEKAAIQDIWRRVAEDYAPFNVDVTTEFTSEAAITRADSNDQVYGTRVLVSPISSYIGSWGGIAYVGVYDTVGDYYKPALVFPEKLGNSTKYIAEAAAHECGHNLGLSHDGTSAQSYYAGSGSGETGWAPIMGDSYSQNLSQWSKGEYPDANNTQDDLSVLTGYLGSRTDDAGNTTSTAVPLPAVASLSASGLVGSSGDVDVYRFVTGAGLVSLSVNPAALGPDLDVYAEIRRPDGSVAAVSNPAGLVSASFSVVLPAGSYYLFVSGTGKGSPLDVGGYSSYASIGQYTVSGTVPFVAPVTTATPLPASAFTSWVSSDVTVTLSAVEPVNGVAWTRYGLGGASEFTYTAPVTISTPGTSTFTYRSQGNSGDAETTHTATVRIDKTPPSTTVAEQASSYLKGSGTTITLVPLDVLSGVSDTRWRYGNSGAFTQGVTVPVPASAGSYTLQFYSIDVVGNVEATKATTVTVTPVPVTRVAGADRFVVAAGLARKGWDAAGTGSWPGVHDVIVACGEDRAAADPLAAAGLAGVYDAPILLVKSGSGQPLPAATARAIAEIASKNPGVAIHIVGGTGSVPDAAWNRIRAIAGVSQRKDRIAGQSRYDVSANIARRMVAVWGDYRMNDVLIVCAENPNAFYDALAASPVAYRKHMPMIGVRSKVLEPAAMKVLGNELAGMTLHFVNSDAFVSRGVKMAIAGAAPVDSLTTSSDRYLAARQISEAALARGWSESAETGIAAKLPDALTGGTYLGRRSGVLLFTDSSTVIRSWTKGFITDNKTSITNGWVIGGTGSVPVGQETSFRSLVQ